MRLKQSWCGSALFLLALALDGHATDLRLSADGHRVTSDKYHFSVAKPAGWFYYPGKDLPLFFSYAAQDAPPQGRLPPHGANIFLIPCRTRPHDVGAPSMTKCVDREVRANNGAAVVLDHIDGPLQGVPAVRATFDQPNLEQVRGTPPPGVHFVFVFWEYAGQTLGAELSYNKGDPKRAHYERELYSLIHSFRPTE